MDPRTSAQDLHRCDLCKTAIVQSYCDICHVNLCKPCIGEHISDEYEKHKIVPFQKRRSTLIYPKCETHDHETCKFQCKDCNGVFVCTFCMASDQHKGHAFVEISEIYKAKKEVIGKDSEKFNNLLIPKYEEIVTDLENQLANLDGGYEKLTTVVSKQGEEWHKEIDVVINKMKTEIGEIKEKHRSILQKHLDEIRQIQSLIKQSLLALKEIEASTEVSTTIGYNSKLEEFSKLPPKVQVSLPTFIPNQIDREKLYGLFGQITPLSTATNEEILPQSKTKPHVKELLEEPELKATIQTGYKELFSVACINEDKVWTSGKSSDINCFDIQCKLLQTIQTKSGKNPADIILDSIGNLIYSDWSLKTVNRVNLKNGQTEVMIRLQGWTPVKLCVISSGDLLVTMNNEKRTQSKVVRYSGSTEKQTIQYDDEDKPLYSGSYSNNNKFITENRNRDICVADCGADAMVVVNQNGKFRWRYIGHFSTSKYKPFTPRGITTDSQSRVLTADFRNHCIHILDHDGQFLRYIDTCCLKDPYDLCLDSNDNLYVCEYNKGNVKKIKYCK